jgi:hypothetical protein
MTTQDVQQIDLKLIELSGGTQSRAGYDETTLAEYVEVWERGVQFPPIDLYFDGEKYWLSDGFHRVASRKRANLPGSTIAAIVHQGTRRDAVLASLGANATHGLKRSNADKRRAVMTLLRDSEWCKWTNTALAQACGVDEGLVRLIKSELSSDNPKIDSSTLAKKCGVDLSVLSEARNQVRSLSEERTARRNGKTYTVNTSKIGSKTSKNPDPAPQQLVEKPDTGWDISPQQLTTTVKNHKIAVHFERRGEEFFFGFRGPEETISASGFYNESCNNPKILKQYLNPGVYADFRAEELYAAHQKSLAESTNTQVNNEMEENADAAVDADEISDEYSLAEAAIDAATDAKPGSIVQPTSIAPEPKPKPEPEPAIAQMLSAAASACLGDFTMPVSLDEPLSGAVYVSPDKAIGAWAMKLVKAYKSGEVHEAIALLTLDHQAFIKFADYALCPLPDGLVAVYLGKRIDSFILCFEDLGTVWHRYGWRP